MTSRWLLPPLWRMVWEYLARYERPMAAEGLPELAAVHTPPTTSPTYRGISKDILRRALEDGNLAAVRWAETKGYALTASALKPRRATTLETEKFLHAHGFLPTCDSVAVCTRGGDAETLRWLSEQKCRAPTEPICFGSLAVARAFVELGYDSGGQVLARLSPLAIKDIDYLRFMFDNFQLADLDIMRSIAIIVGAPPGVLDWFTSKLGPFTAKNVYDAINQASLEGLKRILDSEPSVDKAESKFCGVALACNKPDKLKLLRERGYAWFRPDVKLIRPPGPELCSWLVESKDKGNPMPMAHLCSEMVRLASFESVQLLEKTTGYMHSWLNDMKSQNKLSALRIDGYPTFEMSQWLVEHGFSLKETSYVSVAHSYMGLEVLGGLRQLIPSQTKRIPPQPKSVVLYRLDWLVGHKAPLPPLDAVCNFPDLYDWFENAYAKSGEEMDHHRLKRRCLARDDVEVARWLLKRGKLALDVRDLVRDRAWNVLEHCARSDQSAARRAYEFCTRHGVAQWGTPQCLAGELKTLAGL